jgi:hypothetical protein
MKKIKILIISLLVCFVASSGISQPKENSPYSRFGIGDLSDNSFTFLRSSGLSGSFQSPYQINIVNPASYGFISTTIFDLGFYSKFSSLKTGNNSASTFSGNLDYISLGMPLLNPINDLLEKKERKYDLGLNFTLMPNSIVGFNIKSTSEDPDAGTIKRVYQGSGGTYKFITGLGGRYKNFAIGFNAGYFFGKINYDRELIFEDLEYPYHNKYHSDIAVSGFVYNAGIMYNLVLNPGKIKTENAKVKKLMFGLYGNSSTNFKSYNSIYNHSVPVNLSANLIDTVFAPKDTSGKGKMPLSIGGGVSYNSNNKWIIGANYQSTKWSKYTNEIRQENFKDSYEVSIGAQYTPDENSYTSYFKKVNYRASVYYKTDPRNEDENQFNEKGMHLGFGFPVIYQRKLSNINTDINIGRRGENLLISENFVKISFSVTINDSEWFIKRKYY